MDNRVKLMLALALGFVLVKDSNETGADRFLKELNPPAITQLDSLASTTPTQVDTTKHYSERYDGRDLKRIDEMRKLLVTEYKLDKDYVDAVFDDHRVELVPKIDTLLHGIRDSTFVKWTEDYYKERVNVGWMQEYSPIFYHAHLPALIEAYERDGVDPRAVVAHLGIETHWGGNLGQYVWPNTFITKYAKTNSLKRKQTELWRMAEAIKTSIADTLEPGEMFEIPSSWEGATTGSQLMPEHLLRYFVGIFGRLKNKGYTDMDAAIHATSSYLEDRWAGNWNPSLNGQMPKNISGNRRATWDYNRDTWYNNVIWEDVMPVMSFRTPEELKDLYVSLYPEIEDWWVPARPPFSLEIIADKPFVSPVPSR